MRIESRSYLRIEPNRPLLAHYPQYLGRVRNISLAGAFIETERPLLPGQRLRITFWLELEHTFEIDAVVRHVEPLRGMGVELLNMSGAGIRFLCNYWDERRVAFRRIIPNQILLAEFPHSFGRVRDLSPFGAFIEDKRAVSLGEHISFRLWLNSIDAIPVQAAIRRMEEGRGVGVEFVGMSEADSDRMLSYLSRQH